MTRGETAKAYFTEGYNCAQSVALAFADKVHLDKETLAILASSFGGGFGRLREVCGAFSGAVIIVGLLYGYDDPKADTEKMEHYSRIQRLGKEFEKQTGSLICRELLSLSQKHDDPTPEKRTEGYYQKRPCPEVVEAMANILDKYLPIFDSEINSK